MFGRHKLPDDVQLYKETSVSASNNYHKFKETGKKKFKDRAKADYAVKHALELKMTHPSTNVDKRTINITNAPTKQKTTNVKVNTNFVRTTKSKTKSK